jgi:hypothetical protein
LLLPFKQTILDMRAAKHTVRQIFTRLQNEGSTVSYRSLERQLQKWAAPSARTPIFVHQFPGLFELLHELFFIARKTDPQILQILRSKGYEFTRKQLYKFRLKELEMRRRWKKPDDIEEAQVLAFMLVATELSTGQIDGYGEELRYAHFRKQYMAVTRRRLTAVIHHLNPRAVQVRDNDLNRRRGEYIVPGPNWVWSSDGYDKLKPYGIEIYACIDAYSRFIVWCYTGHTNATAISIASQFISTIGGFSYLPHKIRIDKGRETPMLAQIHFELHRKQIAMTTTDQQIIDAFAIRDCVIYGSGPKNQRQEAWWLQLAKGYVYRFRDFFGRLDTAGEWGKKNLCDRIALIAVYLPIIRRGIQSFINTWNTHYIRAQRGRPHHVKGVPHANYFWADEVENGAVELPQELHRAMAAKTAEWDMDAYLPSETMDFCTSALRRLGFDPLQPPVVDWGELDDQHVQDPYIEIYRALRDVIDCHQNSHHQPTLGLLAKPCGAWNWVPDEGPRGVNDVDAQREVD